MTGTDSEETISSFISEAERLIAAASEYRYLCLTGKEGDEEIPELNRFLFNGEESYHTSQCNPSTLTRIREAETGLLLASWRYQLENAVSSSITGDISRLKILAQGLEPVSSLDTEGIRKVLREDFIKGQSCFAREITGSPVTLETFSAGSLYKTGNLVTDNDLGLFSHISRLDRKTIKRITGAIVEGYVRSFADDGKPMEGLKTVSASLSPGFLALIPGLASRFSEEGLSLQIRSYMSTGESLQAKHDHRFDWALFLDDATVERALEVIEKTLLENSDAVKLHSGSVYLMSFGKRHPEPELKEILPKPNSGQNSLYKNYVLKRQETIDRHIRRSRVSYTGIAFPLPDIGESFSDIFSEMVEVNTLDSQIWEEIQTVLIETLDSAEAVHIKGTSGNKTDIRIAMHSLSDPRRETNFFNGLSTVNIPLGEVFTSPLLKNTTGILHVEEAFLEGILFKDLMFHFTDGYITDYSCSNSKNDSESRQLVYSSLIHPHKTLPVGEFAIGTNTAAYRMARKHGIINLLPVLIAEKMGPHLAIGDTCFRGREDVPCLNRNGKEITARFNEKTELRKTDKENAYTATHKDITLPYESIEKLSAVNSAGDETDIIREGRFVLPGTEHLNRYLD